jgi:hypothetical protein
VALGEWGKLLMVKSGLFSAVAFAVVLGASQPSMAVTINFGVPPNGSPGAYTEGGFQFDTVNRDSGNCASGSCDELGTSTLTKTGGGTFTLDQFYFYLDGGSAELTVTPYSGATALTAIVIDSPHNTGSTYLTAIVDVTKIVFSDTGQGSIRIDDLALSLDSLDPTGNGSGLNTPLPAALPLFAGGLGIFGLLARYRKRKTQAPKAQSISAR